MMMPHIACHAMMNDDRAEETGGPWGPVPPGPQSFQLLVGAEGDPIFFF